jgi:tetratricopeptide (TPR) repeat protein
LAQNDLQGAQRHLIRARDLSPEAGAVHGSLAQVHRLMGDRDAAMRENRLASELTEPVGIGDAVHYAMRQESVSSASLMERAILADRAGDQEKAEALFRELVKVRPEDAALRARFGDTLARQSKIAAAREQYEAALALDAELAAAHYGLGNMLNYGRDYGSAARHYRRAVEIRPDHVPTLVNLGSLLAFQRRPGEAEGLFRRALDVEPQSFGARRQLGALLLQQSRFREAIRHFQAALEARPDSGGVHFQLGMALAATGDFVTAWEHATRAEELGEKVPPEMKEEIRRRLPR